MKNDTHIIKTQVLNIQVPSQENAHDIQNTFSSVYQSHVIPALNEVLSELTKDDEVIRLDKVEIDIGHIRLEDITQQFPEKVYSQVKEELAKTLYKAGILFRSSDASGNSQSLDALGGPGVRAQNIGDSKIDQVIHFLKYGSVPWWTSGKSKLDVADILKQVIKEHPVKFKNEIGKILASESVRKRLIFQFPNKLIQELVQLFSTDYAQFIDLLHQDLKEVQKHIPFVDVSISTFRLKVWDIGIQYLTNQIPGQLHSKAKMIVQLKAKQAILAQIIGNLTQGDTKGNKGSEARKALAKLEHGISATKGKQFAFQTPNFRSLVRAVAEVNLDSGLKGQKEITNEQGLTDALLKETKGETGKAGGKNIKLKEIEDENDSNDKLELEGTIGNEREEIETDKISTSKGELPDDDPSTLDSKQERQELSKEEDDQVASESKEQEDKIDEELIELSKTNILEGTDETTSPGLDKQEEEQNEVSSLNKLDGRDEVISKEQEKKNEAGQKESILDEQDARVSKDLGDKEEEEHFGLKKTDNQNAKSSLDQKDADALQQEAKQEGQMDKNRKLSDQELTIMENDIPTSFGHLDEAIDIDEEYIGNAGLVILWPYLKMLFEELELVDNGSFVNEEAKHRAVHILQYLLNGEEEGNPEFELQLNKLLCGVDVLDPVTSGIEISKAEKIECINLLESVVKNWQALKNTSPEGLRETFLKRQGILTKEEKGWLVKVDRGSFDMLLDTLPWTISIIKLPWNDDVIYVEW